MVFLHGLWVEKLSQVITTVRRLPNYQEPSVSKAKLDEKKTKTTTNA